MVVLLLAAIASFIFVYLSIGVIKQRRANKIALGINDSVDL